MYDYYVGRALKGLLIFVVWALLMVLMWNLA